ncbi:MAG: hypothetical protein V1824_04025 [archaeon]
MNNLITIVKSGKQKKGFTLFTALVSLLLISITLVLIFNMIKTEETYLEIINDRASFSDLITIVDITKADAYDSFVVSLRESWEQFKSKESDPFTLNRELVDMNWDSFVERMVTQEFFSHNFSRYLAISIISKLKYNPPVNGYNVGVKTFNEIACNTQNVDVDNIDCNNDIDEFSGIIDTMFKDGNYEVNLVNCQREDENCVGSFYLTLNTLKLDDSNYEKLPMVTVIRLKNNEVITRPILGRQIYKIYMPWRGFQAFRVARKIAHSSLAESSSDPSLYSEDFGFFDRGIHNTLEQARIGVCDIRSCSPRTSFFTSVSKTMFDKSCTEGYDNQNISTDEKIINGTSFFVSANNSYNLNNLSSNQVNIFKELVLNGLTSNLTTRTDKIVYDNGLNLELDTDRVGTAITDKLKISELAVTSTCTQSKVLFAEQFAGDYEPKEIPAKEFNLVPANNLNSSAGGIGLFLVNNKVVPYYDIKNFSSKIQTYTPRYFTDPNIVQSTTVFRCCELDELTLKLRFKENDIRYKVRDDSEVSIYVNLTDNYSDFLLAPNLNNTNLIAEDNRYFTIAGDEFADPNILPESTEDWACKDYTAFESSKCGPAKDN